MDRYLTPDQPLNKIYRVGAAVFAVVLIVFGVLGLTLGLPLLSVEGAAVLGMGSNGLLAVISIVVGAVLAAAALRGGALASTTMATLGALFLTSGLVNLLVLDTELNVLAFRPANVVFSLLAGLALLCTGLYGRLSGALPEDNAYVRARADRAHRAPFDVAAASAQLAETKDLTDAESALFTGTATPAQRDIAHRDAQRRADEHYRRANERPAGSP